MKRYAIIVAGGSGSRMKSAIPKQFLTLGSEPILLHTIRAFLSKGVNAEVIVVLPKAHLSHWDELSTHYPIVNQVHVAMGGETRTDSVRAGLAKINEENGLVAIHDGVRPYVSSQVILDTYTSAEKYGSGVAAVQIKDSIRKMIDENASAARDRAFYRQVQTPQTFQLSLIRDAYKSVNNASFTDDATVFEQAGFKVYLTEGSYSNIKITTPEDL